MSAAAGREVPEVRSDAALAIALRFDGPYSAASLRDMQREFERIFARSGVRTTWLLPGAPADSGPGVELVVARFHGTCQADGTPAALSAHPLGFTHRINGSILHFSEIDCGQLRAAIRAELASASHTQDERMLGIALARVLAHEVYHIVLRTPDHTVTGIAKPALSPRDLVEIRLDFEPSQLARIGAALRPAPPTIAAPELEARLSALP